MSAAPAGGPSAPASGPRYAINPWPIALTVTIATFMEALDTSIANVALPHIAGSLSATADQATWVLTSYLVSNGIILPLGAWLSEVMGRKRFYMTCVALFTVCSFLCGIAPSLGMLILFRVLQGAGGGGLQPSEQAILADTWDGGGAGAVNRTDTGRLDYRQLQLAMDFLYQRPDRNYLATAHQSFRPGSALS